MELLVNSLFFKALLCAFISVGVMRALQWLFLYYGINSSFNLLSEFCGVFIGFIGTKKIMGIIDFILAIFAISAELINAYDLNVIVRYFLSVISRAIIFITNTTFIHLTNFKGAKF